MLTDHAEVINSLYICILLNDIAVSIFIYMVCLLRGRITAWGPKNTGNVRRIVRDELILKILFLKLFKFNVYMISNLFSCRMTIYLF